MLIWLFAIGQIMRNLDNPVYYFTNAAGFALDIFTGMFVEEKLSIGINIVQIITSHHQPELMDSLKNLVWNNCHRCTGRLGSGESDSLHCKTGRCSSLSQYREPVPAQCVLLCPECSSGS
jgi:uncharacterized protein YebE (UPF0316 family)